MKILNKPLVTVVTVTYNAEKILEKTLQSVINQDYPNIEYVIIDGKSTDGTIEIIKRYEDSIDYWKSESDTGIYDAMNKAIDVAKGEWIIFMNAGDTFVDKETISRVMESIEGEPDIICGDMWRHKGTSQVRKPYGFNYVYDATFVWHQAMLTKTCIMKKFKFDARMKIAADYEFMLRCYASGYKFQFIDVVIADYMEGGISQQNDVLSLTECLCASARYMVDAKEIFEHSFFNQLLGMSNQNMVFVKLFNTINRKINDIIQDKRFVLYGYGNIGQHVYLQYGSQIDFIVDKNYVKFEDTLSPKVFDVTVLGEKEFDYVLISVLGREASIEDELSRTYGIKKEKILRIDL